MRKQAPKIEWQIVEDDAAWALLCASDMPSVAYDNQSSKQFLWTIAAILVLLVSAGGWWYTTQARLHQAKAELQATVERELWSGWRGDDTRTLYWQYHFARQGLAFPTPTLSIDSTQHLDIKLH